MLDTCLQPTYIGKQPSPKERERVRSRIFVWALSSKEGREGIARSMPTTVIYFVLASVLDNRSRHTADTMDSLDSFVHQRPGESVNAFLQRCPPSKTQLYQPWQHWLTVPSRRPEHHTNSGRMSLTMPVLCILEISP